jgi:hypothetical protein
VFFLGRLARPVRGQPVGVRSAPNLLHDRLLRPRWILLQDRARGREKAL